MHKGLEDEGVMAVGKHFPGHGDTHEDSHLTLPSVLRDRAHLDTCELLPFTRYIRAGFSGLMVGHLLVPALDSTGNRPSSLSPLPLSPRCCKKRWVSTDLYLPMLLK